MVCIKTHTNRFPVIRISKTYYSLKIRRMSYIHDITLCVPLPHHDLKVFIFPLRATFFLVLLNSIVLLFTEVQKRDLIFFLK